MAANLSSRSLLSLVLCLFAFFQLSLAAVGSDAEALDTRQTTGTVVTCADYSRVANLSTIGLNSTYRAAFLRSAPFGTDAASAILDTQSPKLVSYMFNVQLNAQCGNLSEVATAGAALNFTNGIVSEFTILEAPGVGVLGLHTPLVVIAILIIMGGTFMSV